MQGRAALGRLERGELTRTVWGGKGGGGEWAARTGTDQRGVGRTGACSVDGAAVGPAHDQPTEAVSRNLSGLRG